MQLVLNAFEACSVTAALSIGLIQACLSAQALLVFVAEQKKQNKLENFLNDFGKEKWRGYGTSKGEDGRGPRVVGKTLRERRSSTRRR